MLKREEYLNYLKKIKLVSVDVDGTMTDGSLYYLDGKTEARRYQVKDGIGILLLQAAGIKTAMMTTGKVASIASRGEALAMDFVEISVFDKAQRLHEICKQMGISMEEVAHIGDDINDVPAFEAVGLGVIVGDAAVQTVPSASFQLKSYGGAGAIREFAEDYYEAIGKNIHWNVVHGFIEQRKAKNKLTNG
ncbi:MAG: KdsC family phosphatase [Alphaproteobacteria bacterium]